jgi:hypothetical protein
VDVVLQLEHPRDAGEVEPLPEQLADASRSTSASL